MRKNSILATGLILAAAVTGCGNSIPEMTGEQQELVVEYAADVLVKHSKNYDGKLVELSVVREAEAKEAAMKQAVKEAAREEKARKEAEKENEETESTSSDVEVIDNTGEAAQQNPSTIEEFLKLDSVKFTYTGHETDSLYPEQGEELFFVMNATEGNKLLILKFQAENLSDGEKSLDIAQSGTRFKIVVNGTEKNALTTMLLNDLAYYQKTLNEGESQEVVLICEVPESEEVSSLGLVMKNEETSTEISLE